MSENLNAVATLEANTNQFERGMTRSADTVVALDKAMRGASESTNALISFSQQMGVTSQKNATLISREIQSTLKLAQARQAAAKATIGGSTFGSGSAENAIKSQVSLFDQQNKLAQQAADSQLRSMMTVAQQENRMFDQRRAQYQKSAEAQVKYAAEAARQGVAYGKMTEQGLISQRYALYDVATTWGMISTAILGTSAVAAKWTIDYERDFASVIRTTQVSGDAIGALKEDLIDLTTAVPASFQDVAGIATLGGQLGVTSDAVDEFTKTVVQFAATTDVSTDAAATGIARLASLTDANARSGEESYKRLGSAILSTGVNAVATESQIIKVGQEIATTGDLYGFAAQQTIGYASALSSIGVPAERARGSFQRTLSVISTAVTEGGADLDKFAALAGQSADEFAKSWNADAAKAFQSVLNGMGDTLRSSGEDYKTFLADLGITASRDAETVARLANNVDILDQALSDSAAGYESGNTLAEQYAIIAETVASKLTILGNTIKAIIVAIGEGGLGPLGQLLDVIQRIAQAFLTLARNPVGQVFLALAAAAGVAVGALAAYRSVQALTIATMLAMKTASVELGSSVTTNNGQMRGAIPLLTQMALGHARSAAAQGAYSAALDQGKSKLAAYAVATKAATIGTDGLKFAVKGLLISTGVGIAIAGLTTLVEHLARSSADAAVDTTALVGTLERATGAITAMTRETVFQNLLDQGTIDKAKELGLDLELVTDAALGNKSAIAQLKSQYQDLFDADVSREGGVFDADKYNQATQAIDTFEGLMGDLGVQSNAVADAQQDYADKIASGANAADESTESAVDLGNALADLVSASLSVADSTVAMQNAMYGLGTSLYENGTSFDVFSASGRANLAALQSAIDAAVKASGDDATALATHLAAISSSLSGFGVNVAAQLPQLTNLMSKLPAPLASTAQYANQAGSALKQGFSAGASKAAKSAKNTQKEVKTLSDYVDDLSKVFSSSFEIRFGLEQSTDDVSSAFADLLKLHQDAQERVGDAFGGLSDAQQSVRDLNVELQDLNATILGLQADRMVLEYQLSVAQEYGDTLRAAEITADLAKNNADLADAENERGKTAGDLATAQSDVLTASQELVTAQAELTRTLDGTSESAIEQRSAVLNLVQSYHDQIAALANTGLSAQQLAARTGELKRQFEDQLRQLGYNSTEIARYSASFNDLRTAIEKVPRKITVDADVDPGRRAVAEFVAGINASRANVGVGADIGNSGSNAAEEWANQFKRTLANAPVAVDGYTFNGQQVYRVPGTGVKLFADGGFTGRGGKYDPAGIVHAGEFVVPKHMVNQSTGLPYANAMGQISQGYAGGGYVRPSPTIKMPGTQIVEFSPTDRALIAALGNVTLTIDGKVLTGVINGNNAATARRAAN